MSTLRRWWLPAVAPGWRRARNFPGTLDYAEQQRWLEHRRQVFTPEFLQGYAEEIQMLAQQYADDKEKVALLKALWQYAEEIV